MKKREGVAAVLLIFLALVSLYVVIQGGLVAFGEFPQRPSVETASYENQLRSHNDSEYISEQDISEIMENRPGNFGTRSISENILQRFSEDTGAANAVTAILWDYRGYDTLGEATVIFVAVASVGALFRVSKEEDE